MLDNKQTHQTELINKKKRQASVSISASAHVYDYWSMIIIGDHHFFPDLM